MLISTIRTEILGTLQAKCSIMCSVGSHRLTIIISLNPAAGPPPTSQISYLKSGVFVKIQKLQV